MSKRLAKVLLSISKDASPDNRSDSKLASRLISFIAITLNLITLVSNTLMLGLAGKEIEVRVKGGSLTIDIRSADAIMNRSLNKLARSSDRASRKKG